MRMADITVAIATLDRPESLARCLDGVLNGLVLPAEIIIVDQSRENATQSHIAGTDRGDGRIIYVRQERCGLSASRNAAIRCARQPIIAFTDDDCVPDGVWVSSIERAFAASPSPDAVAGRVLPLGPAKPDTYGVSPREGRTRTDWRGRRIPWLVGTGGNFAARRDWFSRIGMYDQRLGTGAPGRAAEDADMIYRLLRAGACIRYEPDAIVYHERQGKAQRLASRWTYGHGIGALCGMWLRRGDPFAFWMLGYWLLGLFREMPGILVRRQWMETYQRIQNLHGTFSGFAYGLFAG